MAEESDVKYCRREAVDGKFCMRPIKARNALNWCLECRAARLPFWPADDAPQAAPVTALEAFEVSAGGQ